jgi:hypothetical protein
VSLRSLPVLLSLVFWELTGAASAQSEADPPMTEVAVQYTFGEQLQIRAYLPQGSDIQSAALFLQAEGEPVIATTPAQVSLPGAIQADYDLAANPLPAFARITFWFEAIYNDGQTARSADFHFTYLDNRYDWRTLDEGPFRVHWYQGEEAFAREVLETAQAGLDRAQAILPFEPAESIQIYVYDNAADLQATLRFAERTLVAGHAHPQLGVVLVSLPTGPDQGRLMAQRIPHEVMHILIYQGTGPAYGRLPVWLLEGLASISELAPNEENALILEDAVRREALLPMPAICRSFPGEASGALQAYAQSASFTQYLYERFGTTGLLGLVMQYAGGADCEQGMQAALGEGLGSLEGQWQETSFPREPLPAGQLLPWILLLGLALAAPAGLAFSGLLRRGK